MTRADRIALIALAGTEADGRFVAETRAVTADRIIDVEARAGVTKGARSPGPEVQPTGDREDRAATSEAAQGGPCRLSGTAVLVAVAQKACPSCARKRARSSVW